MRGGAAIDPFRPVDVALRDGSTLRVRSTRGSDKAAILAFLERQDPDDLALRFFGAGSDVAMFARWAVDLGPPDGCSLVAVAADDRTVLAHGCLVIDGMGSTAEVAFLVDRRLRGEGVATTMLAHLAAIARGAGIEWLTAVVMPGNRRMLEVFDQSGLPMITTWVEGELRVALATALGSAALERYDERDAVAAAAAVEHVLRPRSVAVIGASDRPGSVGRIVLENLVAGGFTGGLHAVNRKGGRAAGLPVATTVAELDPVDLAVIAIPADNVLDAAGDCARHGVRALVVLSDGFADAGPAGRERQRELVDLCRRAGMRLVGPNCLGVINTDPSIRLDASFAPHRPPPGRVAFLSQSGAVAIAATEAADERGLGLSSLVSVGDKADLSSNDFLSFWERDDGTDVVLLYLEGFGNPRKFSRIARRVARRKPIVAVKGGRSVAGAAAAGSHTGALVAASDATVGALFEQAGVIPTDTLGELFDVAALLASQPPPRGLRVGIVGNGGGIGILCADACAAAGLDVVELPEAVREALGAAVSEHAVLRNPIDLLAAARPEHYEHAISCLAASGAVDAIIAHYVPPSLSAPDEVAAAIASARSDISVAAVLAMAEPPLWALRTTDASVPCYRLPEEAARAVGRSARYGRWRDAPVDAPAAVEVDVVRAAGVIGAALERGGGWLTVEDTAALLDAYGIAAPPQQIVGDPAEAAVAARTLGGRVALKALAKGLVHRSDVGAVAVGLSGPVAVRREAMAMAARVERAGYEPSGFVVQSMAPVGVELLVGVVSDPLFGPVVACAAGGVTAELLGDSAVRMTPITRRAAAELVRSLRSFPLLDGFRGAERCDVAAVEDLLVRIGALADAHPAIAELDCNPVVVDPDGLLVVDARVRVAAIERPLPAPSLTPVQ